MRHVRVYSNRKEDVPCRTTMTNTCIRAVWLAHLVPPAAGILNKAFLGGRQRREQIPDRRSVALARQLVATDVRTSHSAFPDPYLLQKPSAACL